MRLTKNSIIRLFRISIVCATTLVPACATPQVIDAQSVVDFLRRNATVLDLYRPEAGLGPNSIDTKNRQIFLLGEVHGISVNYSLDFALLQHLHRVAGVRTYLMEFSHANAQFMNEFLETGDPATLNFALGQMWGFADCSEERRHFFVELRKWNLTLPPTERVRVVGFDLERMPGVSLEFLRRQFAGLTPPGSIREVMERLRTLPEKPDRDEVRNIVTDLSASVDKQRNTYAALLQERWFDFDLALDNLVASEQLKADPAHYDSRRDAVQYNNFVRIAKHDHFVRAYGRVGSAHVLQRPTEGIKHFSVWLESPASPWAGKVVGIWPIYVGCQQLAFAHGHYNSVAYPDTPRVVQPFVNAAAGDVVLFKLTGRNAPFARELILTNEATDGVTTDYFQYAVLIKAAVAAIPASLDPARER